MLLFLFLISTASGGAPLARRFLPLSRSLCEEARRQALDMAERNLNCHTMATGLISQLIQA